MTTGMGLTRGSSLFILSLVIFIQLGYVKTQVTIYPRIGVNLLPSETLKRAVSCLKNKSESCSPNSTLERDGVLSVQPSDMQDYCWGGCFNHTIGVLQCIHDVMKGFRFQNQVSVEDMRDIIANSCANLSGNLTGFSTSDMALHKNRATSFYPKSLKSMLLTLATLVVASLGL